MDQSVAERAEQCRLRRAFPAGRESTISREIAASARRPREMPRAAHARPLHAGPPNAFLPGQGTAKQGSPIKAMKREAGSRACRFGFGPWCPQSWRGLVDSGAKARHTRWMGSCSDESHEAAVWVAHRPASIYWTLSRGELCSAPRINSAASAVFHPGGPPADRWFAIYSPPRTNPPRNRQQFIASCRLPNSTQYATSISGGPVCRTVRSSSRSTEFEAKEELP